jgi:amino acid adenylation domain-containing protein
MSVMRALHQSFVEAAARFPANTAVVEPGEGSISYQSLDELSNRVREYLHGLGVGPGERVGLCLRKSIDTVAAILGALKSGAAYVPVDPAAPSARNAYIMHNCGVKVLIADARFEEKLKQEIENLGGPIPHLLILDGTGGGHSLANALTAKGISSAVSPFPTLPLRHDDLAYILYTSGSTGKPKGVMLTHENAVSFVDWCTDVFQPRSSDRFSSHAPFHFDLSILDIHLSLKHGATLVLVSEDIGKDPVRLAKLIADERISIWYSAPSILSLLAQFGNLPDYDYSGLRHILFAGEVFPVKHQRMLTQLLPMPQYFNLYGPTETNVCNFHEVLLPVPDERTTPYPIGKVCSHLVGKVIDANGAVVSTGQEGELCISGHGVMLGYWSLPEQTARAFLADTDGTRWYKTGDIVVEEQDGIFIYRGRRDRMVKRRGYRVELGEIEACLYKHPLIKEAAVVAVPDEEAGVKINAFLGAGEAKRLSLIEIKRFCAENLPLYMIPDRFTWYDTLPKTSTDKIDYQRLKEAG